MKASTVSLKDLLTYEDHQDAIDAIERDPKNTIGGMKAWKSGYATYLTKTAINKIEAIEARCDRLHPVVD